METQIHNNLVLHGSLVIDQDLTSFPENPALGTIIVKEQALYAYIKIGGLETWYPFASKTNSYVHSQGIPSSQWLVTHNLNSTNLWTQVKDSTGSIVLAQVVSTGPDTLTVTLTTPIAGTIIVVAPDSINVPEMKADIISAGAGSVIIDADGIKINGDSVLTSPMVDAVVDGAIDSALQNYVVSFVTNNRIVTSNTTAATSTTTGALTVAGGIGVSGNVVATSVYTDSLYRVDGTPFISTTNVDGVANILYVAKNGNDTNDGKINSPFLTIKAALQAATQPSSVFVAPGTYTENNPLTIPAGVSLKGDDIRAVTIIPQNPASDLFYVKNASYVWGITIKDYEANGFAYDPATSTQNVFVSPYIQNVTSSTTANTATAVKIDGSVVSSISTKAMILGFFTIINRGGKGVHLVNQAYSQAVNIYTIAADVGILAESGSFITLNGSDNSIGNYGLKAIGKGPELLSGTTFGESRSGTFLVRGLSAQPKVNQTMTIAGDSNYYGIDTITQIDGLTWQVTVQEVYTNVLAAGTTVKFFQRSAIIASAHTFEYVGAGTNPATALPQYGGIPIEANEVTQADGGRVTFTSTDHKGNFKIGANLVINQATGIINGDSFNRSMFALMTPYILALEG